jgi:ribonucleoside-triphosphate reductase
MYQVTKRDGTVVSFDMVKIASAIQKAFEATETPYTESVIDFLAIKVTSHFISKIKDGKIAVEEIQDNVEAILSESGYADVAKA